MPTKYIIEQSYDARGCRYSSVVNSENPEENYSLLGGDAEVLCGNLNLLAQFTEVTSKLLDCFSHYLEHHNGPLP